MKKTMISILMFCLSFAQFEAGKKSIGGGVEFNRSSMKYTIPDIGELEMTETKTEIKPSGEYFVTNNLSLGGSLTYSMITKTISIDEVEEYNSGDDPDFENPMGFGFYGKYFMGTAYGHLGYYEPDNSEKGDEFLGIGLGYVMPLTDNIYIDSSVTYRHLLNAKDGIESTLEDNGYGIYNEISGIEVSPTKFSGSVGVIVIF